MHSNCLFKDSGGGISPLQRDNCHCNAMHSSSRMLTIIMIKIPLHCMNRNINSSWPRGLVATCGVIPCRPCHGVLTGRDTLYPRRRHIYAYNSLRDDERQMDESVGVVVEASETESSTVHEGELIEIGVVGPPHGVKGEFKVQSLTDWPQERLGTKGSRYLKAPESKLTGRRAQQAGIQKVKLMYGRQSIYKGREVWIVKIKGINSPEEAQDIRGYTLMVHESVREELDDDDEFYIQELIGLSVDMADSGEHIGTVIDLLDGTGTYDVLQIRLAADEECIAMLPFAKDIVPVVDLKQGVMKVTPPEGLLDIFKKTNKKA